jgi:hypothetical protein
VIPRKDQFRSDRISIAPGGVAIWQLMCGALNHFFIVDSAILYEGDDCEFVDHQLWVCWTYIAVAQHL